jgi:hypothetical protein
VNGAPCQSDEGGNRVMGETIQTSRKFGAISGPSFRILLDKTSGRNSKSELLVFCMYVYLGYLVGSYSYRV